MSAGIHYGHGHAKGLKDWREFYPVGHLSGASYIREIREKVFLIERAQQDVGAESFRLLVSYPQKLRLL
jgi:hypothetical protein